MAAREDAQLILRHLEKHGVCDKDRVPCGARRSDGRRRRGQTHPTIDLHGLTLVQAEAALRSAVDRGRNAGMRSLLVIHGAGIHSDPVGGPVLGDMVMQLVEGALRPLIRDHKKAPPALGGDGARILYLR
jgi:DNA-nicking Smr family endonuclease